jgi:hypothetical protein
MYGTVAGFVVQRKGFPDLQDHVLGLAVIISPGVKFGVHRERCKYPCSGQQGVGLLGFDINRVVVIND